jgi:hypothetical protein
MSRKSFVLLFVLVISLGEMACSKKQTETGQASQTPAAQTSPTPPSSATTAPPSSATTAPTAKPSAPKARAVPETRPAATASTKQGERAETRRAAAVPAGTALVVRLNNAVSSKTAQQGATFTATVAKPVTVGGETLIPSGAEVTGRVTDVKSAGKLSGAAHMGLTLTSITLRGQSYKVTSNAIAQTSTGKGKRTAVLGGGGAALGATVGALAGGGKGALVGALAGGGAGTAGSAFTGNADITLPAESMLSFRLSEPLDLGQPTTFDSSK